MEAGNQASTAVRPTRPPPPLPPEVLWQVVAEVEAASLVPLAQASRQFRQLVARACRSERRQRELVDAIERRAPSAFCRTLRDFAPVLDLLSGSLRLPSPPAPQAVSAACRALCHSQLRPCLHVAGPGHARQLRALPAGIDVDWTLALPALTHPFQLPRLPAGLSRLTLDVEEACVAGLESLFLQLAPQARLSLTLEHMGGQRRPLAVPATLRLDSLSVPAAWLACPEFSGLLQHPGIAELGLSDGDDVDLFDGDAEPGGGPLVRIAPPASLHTIGCSPASFWRLDVRSLCNLRRVEFEAEALAEAVERLADLPRLESVRLIEKPQQTGGAASLGAALARWPLPDGVHTLSLRTHSLEPWFRHIRWPEGLRTLKLDFCDLGDALRYLHRCPSVEHLSLVCTQAGEALFHASWPRALRRLELDLDDLPARDAEPLRRLLPGVELDLQDL